MTKEEKFFEDLSVIGNPKSRISEGLIEKTVDDISVMVNSFSFNPRKVGEEMLTNEVVWSAFRPLAMLWIKQLSLLYSQKRYDRRNEDAVMMAKNIMLTATGKKVVESGVGEWSENNGYNQVVQKFSREHRTLQQSFSSLCFFLFTHDVKQNVDAFEKEMADIGVDVVGYDYWRMPMI